MIENTKHLISIIMPVLNEAGLLKTQLQALQEFRTRGHELIVIDGGSRDDSLSLARLYADRVLMSGPSRSLQMNAGVDLAKHDVLLFLHADTRLPPNADELVAKALQNTSARWGRFDLRLDSRRWYFRLIEWSINWRSALSGIATGDQAIFVEREYFERVGCFNPHPLMEDVALSKKLLYFSWPQRIRIPVLSSARKWQTGGVLRTILLMWFLRVAYFFGAKPERLAQLYYASASKAE